MQYRRRALAAFVLAASSWAPAVADATAFSVVSRPHGFVASCSVDAGEALRRINAARAAGQRCGWRKMPPARALHWDGTLQSVAAAHSRDMARRNYFDHRTPEGRTVRDRVARTGYKSRLVGENLAGGDRDLGGALQGWIDSPAHCENLMNPEFNEVAVACVGQRDSQWGTYWTMMLGKR
ncbi:CAP domain-containing protein [Ramlibacter sp. USB13]|uniref:CAP domain-containing protein n=1 Tax=Ramlibacter cellulosilyticus TaxID=2764187 RepID=A0A923MTX7_9BURK|nr:CAP domain-containing protein [Ramlibacter cellulosilyticus]MBC5785792.1 CAP domain-containing protein [Ramlibacter cellulosilyticus]